MATMNYLLPSGGDDSAEMDAALAAGGLVVMGPGTFLFRGARLRLVSS